MDSPCPLCDEIQYDQKLVALILASAPVGTPMTAEEFRRWLEPPMPTLAHDND